MKFRNGAALKAGSRSGARSDSRIDRFGRVTTSIGRCGPSCGHALYILPKMVKRKFRSRKWLSRGSNRRLCSNFVPKYL